MDEVEELSGREGRPFTRSLPFLSLAAAPKTRFVPRSRIFPANPLPFELSSLLLSLFDEDEEATFWTVCEADEPSLLAKAAIRPDIGIGGSGDEERDGTGEEVEDDEELASELLE